ncbi:MAG TPA: TetR/AcrR family transcriptional regulator [Aquabacterium sp.]|uniref:TetR/AcrR family transcriptional regulator n=1 Tax=Aquabacterium sp. TaxID=1872578 RepID=UPI002E309AD3|nr:TetR/AcrR family transcriptional regulator [Aquabacterium sp.]HEX5357439.1 TetR/AcrR family transcriptional regulator [Aquabacterium sp.]
MSSKVTRKAAGRRGAALRSYAGVGMSERKALRRARFLDAGLEVFGTSGYRSATVRMLCKQAELTDRYFYESFESMEDLLIGVYQREFERLNQALLPVLSDAIRNEDPMAGVRAGLEVMFSMVEDDRVARVCWLEILGVSDRVDEVFSNCVDQFATLLLLAARVNLPNWRPDPMLAHLLGVALIGTISQIVTQTLLKGYACSKAVKIDAAALVFEGTLSLIRRQTQTAAR